MFKQYIKAIEKSNIVSKTDTKGIITFVNDEFCAISGYTKKELIGKNHNIVRHPDVPASTFKTLWNTIKAKKIYKSTVKNRAKDGSTFYVNTTVVPILNDNNEIIEFVAIRYDVTKEIESQQALKLKEIELQELNKTLEQKVAQKTKQLKLLNESLQERIQQEVAKGEERQRILFWQSRMASLGQMLANIAHQWRQPLTELGLINFNMKTSMLNHDKAQMMNFYKQSKDIIKNMSATIDDFANFFKPNKDTTIFDVSTCIKEALNIIQTLITQENVNINLNLTDVKINGIPNELIQVLINLVKNSIDAFVINNITTRNIDITMLEENNFVTIKLQDNGGGIPKNKQEIIFEPYFTTKHASQGTGLGLFISKMICEHGFNGSLHVHSQNSTTAFYLKFPVASAK